MTMTTSIPREDLMITSLLIWFFVITGGVTLQCGGIFVLDREMEEFTITSPGYPEKYPKFSQCQWTVISTINKKLSAEFLDFSVEDQNPCLYDKLLVDGDACDFQSPIILCGNTQLQPIESTENILCFRFLSDFVVNGRGFKVKVKLLAEDSYLSLSPGAHYTPDENGRRPDNSSIPCDVFPVLITDDAIITSPGFESGQQYPANTTCRWLVYLDIFHVAILQFTNMDIEDHDLCDADSIQIIQGDEAAPDFSQKFCGSKLPDPVTILDPTLVIFTSDGMIQGQGFSASLKFVLRNFTQAFSSSHDDDAKSAVADDLYTSVIATRSLTSTPSVLDHPLQKGLNPAEGEMKMSLSDTTSSSILNSQTSSHAFSTSANSFSRTNSIPGNENVDIANTFNTNKGTSDSNNNTIMLLTSFVFQNFTKDFSSSQGLDEDVKSAFIDDLHTEAVVTTFLTSQTAVFAFSMHGENTETTSNLNHLNYHQAYNTNTGQQSVADYAESINNNENFSKNINENSNINNNNNNKNNNNNNKLLNETTTSSKFGLATSSTWSLTTIENIISTSVISDSGHKSNSFVYNDGVNINSMSGQFETINICSQTFYNLTLAHVVIQSPGFDSGAYPLYIRCDVVVAAEPNTRLKVSFRHMDLENSEGCYLDWLEISSRSRSMGKFCGSVASDFVADDRMILLTFVSDPIVAKYGFQLQIDKIEDTRLTRVSSQDSSNIAMCDSIFDVVDKDGMLVISPGYSQTFYPLDTECDLKLFASSSFQKLKVTILDMDIEPHRACSYDYLIIYDGVTTTSLSLARMCGNQTGNIITSSGPTVQLHFFSDHFVARKGFKLKISPDFDKESLIVTSTEPTSLRMADTSEVNVFTTNDGSYVNELSHLTQVLTTANYRAELTTQEVLASTMLQSLLSSSKQSFFTMSIETSFLLWTTMMYRVTTEYVLEEISSEVAFATFEVSATREIPETLKISTTKGSTEPLEEIATREKTESQEISTSKGTIESVEVIATRETTESHEISTTKETIESVEVIATRETTESVAFATRETTESIEVFATRETTESIEVFATREIPETLKISTTKGSTEPLEEIATRETTESHEISITKGTIESVEVIATRETTESIEVFATRETTGSIEVFATRETTESIEVFATRETAETHELLTTLGTTETHEIVASQGTAETHEISSTKRIPETLEISATKGTTETQEIIATSEIIKTYEVPALRETTEVVFGLTLITFPSMNVNTVSSDITAAASTHSLSDPAAGIVEISKYTTEISLSTESPVLPTVNTDLTVVDGLGSISISTAATDETLIELSKLTSSEMFYLSVLTTTNLMGEMLISTATLVESASEETLSLLQPSIQVSTQTETLSLLQPSIQVSTQTETLSLLQTSIQVSTQTETLSLLQPSIQVSTQTETLSLLQTSIQVSSQTETLSLLQPSIQVSTQTETLSLLQTSIQVSTQTETLSLLQTSIQVSSQTETLSLLQTSIQVSSQTETLSLLQPSIQVSTQTETLSLLQTSIQVSTQTETLSLLQTSIQVSSQTETLSLLQPSIQVSSQTETLSLLQPSIQVSSQTETLSLLQPSIQVSSQTETLSLLQPSIQVSSQTEILSLLQPSIQVSTQTETLSLLQPSIQVSSQTETLSLLQPSIQVSTQTETLSLLQPSIQVSTQTETLSLLQPSIQVSTQTETLSLLQPSIQVSSQTETLSLLQPSIQVSTQTETLSLLQPSIQVSSQTETLSLLQPSIQVSSQTETLSLLQPSIQVSSQTETLSLLQPSIQVSTQTETLSLLQPSIQVSSQTETLSLLQPSIQVSSQTETLSLLQTSIQVSSQTETLSLLQISIQVSSQTETLSLLQTSIQVSSQTETLSLLQTSIQVSTQTETLSLLQPSIQVSTQTETLSLLQPSIQVSSQTETLSLLQPSIQVSSQTETLSLLQPSIQVSSQTETLSLLQTSIQVSSQTETLSLLQTSIQVSSQTETLSLLQTSIQVSTQTETLSLLQPSIQVSTQTETLSLLQPSIQVSSQTEVTSTMSTESLPLLLQSSLQISFQSESTLLLKSSTEISSQFEITFAVTTESLPLPLQPSIQVSSLADVTSAIPTESLLQPSTQIFLQLEPSSLLKSSTHISLQLDPSSLLKSSTQISSHLETTSPVPTESLPALLQPSTQVFSQPESTSVLMTKQISSQAEATSTIPTESLTALLQPSTQVSSQLETTSAIPTESLLQPSTQIFLQLEPSSLLKSSTQISSQLETTSAVSTETLLLPLKPPTQAYSQAETTSTLYQLTRTYFPSATSEILLSQSQTPTTPNAEHSTSSSPSLSTLESACSGVPSLLTEKSGLIASPGFLQHEDYPTDIMCNWIIEGGQGKNISIKFQNFNLEYQRTCSYDFVELYNVTSGSQILIGRYCGQQFPDTITSSGDSLVIVFVSDRIGRYAGFSLSYTVYEVATYQPPCPYERVRCKDDQLCIQKEWLCDAERDCPLGEDEANCYGCGDDEFTCSDNTCLQLYHVCDGISNCNYGEDEAECVKVNNNKVLLIRKEGLWFPACANERLSDSLLQWACTATGQGNQLSALSVTVLSPFYANLMVTPSNTTSVVNNQQTFGEEVEIHISSKCQDNKVISLSCAATECGVENVHLPQPYILGSSSSVDGQWPWAVALFSGAKFNCGATLISRQWLVSAGHCVYNLVNSPQTTTARLGRVNIQSPDVIVVRIVEVIVHPQNNFINENDISLLRLETAVEIDTNQRPVCLDSLFRDWSPHTACYVAGWGVTDKSQIPNPQATPILHHAKISIWEQSKCERTYPGKIKQSMLCAGYQDGEMDACKGDSGGPLMCATQFHKWQLVGVVSWGEGCGEILKPGVYTRVDSYLDWIKSTTDEQVNYGVSCDFEYPNVCGYSSQSDSEFLWTRRMGGTSSPARPYADSTFKNSSGHYMYTYVPHGAKYKTVMLTSPLVGAAQTGYCIQASVIIQDCSKCKFEVRITNVSGNLSQTLLQVTSEFTSNWLRFEVDLPLDTDKINFLSTSGEYSDGGIGLDDVTLAAGLCGGSKLLNCRFSINSENGSGDQTQYTLCAYLQDPTDDFDWVVSNGSGEMGTNDGLADDAFIRAQSNGYPGDIARIISPALKTSISMCLMFRIRVSSANAGVLTVCRKLYFNGNPTLDCSVWSTGSSNIKLQTWIDVKVSLSALDIEFSVVFQVAKGEGEGYIDVDNIHKVDGDCI